MAVLVLPMTGCSSEKTVQSNNRSDSISRFRYLLREVPGDIAYAMEALHELQTDKHFDRAESFRKFSERVAWMQRSVSVLGREVERAEANSLEYFSAWVWESMPQSSHAARKMAQENMAVRKDLRDEALTYLTGGHMAYLTFADQLLVLKLSLQDNLTESHIDALSSKFAQAERNARDVMNGFRHLDKNIDTALCLLGLRSRELWQDAARKATGPSLPWLEKQNTAIAMAQSGYSSKLIVTTHNPGAVVKYRLIALPSVMTAGKPSNNVLETIPIGVYHIWCERNGAITSSEDNMYTVVEELEEIALQEVER